MPHALSRRIAEVLTLRPEADAIEFEQQWVSWRRLDRSARAIGALVGAHGAAGPAQVGILLRNRPVHVAALLGVLSAGATVVVVNPSRGADRLGTDLGALKLPVLIGDPEDLAAIGIPDPGCRLIAVTDLHHQPRLTPASIDRACAAARPGVAVRMLTSGTTGPPKRIDLTYDMLAHSVIGADAGNATAPADVRRGVAIVNSPLVHIGGVFRVLSCVSEARPFVLLERFDLDRWADAVRRHRPRAASLVPAALRMVLHSDLRREDLESLRAVTSGTAPLSADDAEAFTARFGVPVLTSYAATEFGGGVAGWTLADHRRYWAAKRGSVGRANPGARLRVVDEDRRPLAAGQTGLLEVVAPALGPDATWMPTTDLARIDADGFLWIVGRADQAIIRGGFKVMPDDVRTALESHPAVAGAVVIGRPDDRLGEVPAAMVELRTPISASTLSAHLADRLARYEMPTDIRFVDAIPRTPSGKPDLSAVRTVFAATPTEPPAG